MLAQFGVEEERLRLSWVSASEGAKYASIVNDMTEKVRALGPLKLNDAEGKHGKN
jgi:F420-non-reducing hydrogenase iron-sulfur subunit